ncbi:MAG: AsmA-like C-terminal region-containing protein [Opitutales bacterium]
MTPRTPYFRKKRGCWIECWRWANTLLCLGLLMVLCLQAYVLVYLLRTGQLPVPDLLVEQVNAGLAPHDLSLEAGTIRLSMRGVVLVKDAQLRARGMPEPIAEADFLQLRLGARFGLSEVRVANLNLYCPAPHSPTGERETALSAINGRLLRGEDAWIFDNLRTWLQPRNVDELGERALLLRLTGSIPVAEEEGAEVSVEEPLQQYFLTARQLCALKEQLNVFETPRLNISFAGEDDGALRIRPVFRADSVETDNGLRAEALRIEGRLRWENDGRLNVTEPLHGRVRSAWWQDIFASDALHFSADLETAEEGQLPGLNNIHFGAQEARTPERTFDSISGRLDRFDPGFIEGSLVLTEGLHVVQMTGFFQPDTKSGEVHLKGRFEPRALFGENSFSGVPALQYLTFDDRPKWEGTIRVGEDFTLRNLLVNVQSGGGTFCEANVRSLSLQAYADPDVIHLPRLFLHTGEWSVRGSFLHNQESGAYRLLAQGSMWPEEVEAVMPRWWGNLWSSYAFTDRPPQFDVDLQGNTLVPDSTTVFAGTRMRDFAYEGVDLSEMETKVWFASGFLNIFDLNVTRPDGNLRGEVQLVYHHNADLSHRQHYILETQMPLDVLGHFVDDQVRDILDDFEPSANPRLGIQATLFGSQTLRQGESFVLFEAELDEPVLWRGFPLDYLRLSGDHNPRQLELPQIEFGFAGGTGEAKVLWDYHPGPDRMSVALRLDDAEAIDAIRKVPYFDVDGLRAERLPTLPDTPSPGLGLMDFRFDGEGLSGDLRTFRSKGLLTIDDTDIRQIPFFTGLTDAVNEQTDSPTRMTFTEFGSTYQLSNGLLHFPDITMRGSTARLRGSGNFNFNDLGLSFKAVVYPFGQVRTPVVSQVFSLFGPLAKTFEVRLYGTAQEPVWRVKFDPFGVVREKGVVRPPEDSGHVAQEFVPDSEAFGMPVRDIEPLAPLQPRHPLFAPGLDPWMPLEEATEEGAVAAGVDGLSGSGS